MREAIRWVAAAAVLGLLYLGYTGLVRHDADREFRKRFRSRPSPAAPPEENRRLVQHFYANTGNLVRGEQAVICYATGSGAISVELDPPVEPLKPHWNRCFAVAPPETTRYRLTVHGPEGDAGTAEFTIAVRAPAPELRFFAVSRKEVAPGEGVAVCYRFHNVVSAHLEPAHWKLETEGKHCVQPFPAATTEFAVVGFGEDGRSVREKFRVEVVPYRPRRAR